MPFKVIMANKAEVEVLGTHFNINAYDNEPAINTTLLEGSVKVAKDAESAIIKPGQQAIIFPPGGLGGVNGLVGRGVGVTTEYRTVG